MTFDDALAWVLKEEGGFANRSEDRGGPTNCGVTQKAYNAWRVAQDLTPADIGLISADEVRAIYETAYWTAAACQQYGGELGLAVFDMAVMSGPGTSVRYLQRALWLAEDGIAGPDTVSRANAGDWRLVAYTHLTLRRAFYRSLPDSSVNPGWYGRLGRLKDLVMAAA
jgi:lysozyme family protein